MKDKLIQIRADAELLSKLEYLQLINGFKSISETIRKIVEKEWRKEQPQGNWIEVDDATISCVCSVCSWESHLYEDDVYGMPYCPNCGAKMK